MSILIKSIQHTNTNPQNRDDKKRYATVATRGTVDLSRFYAN